MEEGEERESARVVVVGDSAVGKTTLLHLICEQRVNKQCEWTVGANCFVTLHKPKPSSLRSSSSLSKEIFIELVDIGGSSSLSLSRSLFFSPPFDGFLPHPSLINFNYYT